MISNFKSLVTWKVLNDKDYLLATNSWANPKRLSSLLANHTTLFLRVEILLVIKFTHICWRCTRNKNQEWEGNTSLNLWDVKVETFLNISQQALPHLDKKKSWDSVD